MGWTIKIEFYLYPAHCIFSLSEYFTDLEGRPDQDPSLQWDFYSSSVFGRKLHKCVIQNLVNNLSFHQMNLVSFLWSSGQIRTQEWVCLCLEQFLLNWMSNRGSISTFYSQGYVVLSFCLYLWILFREGSGGLLGLPAVSAWRGRQGRMERSGKGKGHWLPFIRVLLWTPITLLPCSSITNTGVSDQSTWF